MHKGFKDYVLGLATKWDAEEKQLALEMLTHDPEGMRLAIERKISDWARMYVSESGGVVTFQRVRDAGELIESYCELFKDELAAMA